VCVMRIWVSEFGDDYELGRAGVCVILWVAAILSCGVLCWV
jgi:hypothetical protein